MTLNIMTLSTAIIKNETKNAVGATTVSLITLNTMTFSTTIIKN